MHLFEKEVLKKWDLSRQNVHQTLSVFTQLSIYNLFVSCSEKFASVWMALVIHSIEASIKWLGHPFIKNISPFKWIGHLCVEKHQPIWTTWTIFCQTTCIIYLEGSKFHSLKITPFKQHQSSVLIFRRFVQLH